MFRLIGPGGAGKTTVGRKLANRLGVLFIDLDERFRVRAGDIRARFSVYWGMTTKKVESMKPVDVVVDELVTALRSSETRLWNN